jgi:hypothetical protein
MKGTIHGNRLPRGYASEKMLGTIALKGKHNYEWQRVQAANERYADVPFMFIYI